MDHNQSEDKLNPRQLDSESNSNDTSLKGAFVSVMALGGFLAITWLIVFIIFIVRNGG